MNRSVTTTGAAASAPEVTTHDRRMERLRRVAWVLDSSLRIPGTQIRFGVDMIIGMVPGLGDLPLIGRLFTSANDTDAKTEIVLLITPRVVRNIARRDLQNMEFPSGTDLTVGAPPLAFCISAESSP